MEQPKKILRIDREQMVKYFFFGVFIFLIYEFLKILFPFMDALLISSTLTIIFLPLHLTLKKFIPGRPNATAAISSAIVIILVILPVFLVSWLLIKESTHIYPRVQTLLLKVSEAKTQPIGDIIPASMDEIWNKIEKITKMVDYEVNEKHKKVTSIILEDLKRKDYRLLTENITRAGFIRGFLG